MSYRAHKFSDPTGGGEDVIVLAPEWCSPGGILLLHDKTGDHYEFQGETVGDGPEVQERLVDDLVDLCDEGRF